MLYVFILIAIVYVSFLLRYLLKHVLKDTHPKNLYDSY